MEVVSEGCLDVTHRALLESQLVETYLLVGVFVEDELRLCCLCVH